MTKDRITIAEFEAHSDALRRTAETLGPHEVIGAFRRWLDECEAMLTTDCDGKKEAAGMLSRGWAGAVLMYPKIAEFAGPEALVEAGRQTLEAIEPGARPFVAEYTQHMQLTVESRTGTAAENNALRILRLAFLRRIGAASEGDASLALNLASAFRTAGRATGREASSLRFGLGYYMPRTVAKLSEMADRDLTSLVRLWNDRSPGPKEGDKWVRLAAFAKEIGVGVGAESLRKAATKLNQLETLAKER